MEAVAQFEALARDYCAFVEGADALGRQALLEGIEGRIAHLYAWAVDLPNPELLDDGDTEMEVDGETAELRARLSSSLSGADFFRVVFDPWSEDAPIDGSLSDAIADIYRDLREGLGLLDAGRPEDALWSWRFNFNSHWGRHAVEALAAIYALTRAGRV